MISSSKTKKKKQKIGQSKLTNAARKSSLKNASDYEMKRGDVPVTQAMLFGVRDYLDKKIESVEKKLESFQKGLEAKINNLGVLIEEQNARNIVVLDGLANLFHRQERLEKDAQEQKETLNQVVETIGKRF